MTSSCDSSSGWVQAVSAAGWPPVLPVSSGWLGICCGRRGRGNAGFGPFVVLFGQHGRNEADQSVAVGEDADDVGAPADFLVEALGVVRPNLAPDLLGDRQKVSPVALEDIGKWCSHRAINH